VRVVSIKLAPILFVFGTVGEVMCTLEWVRSGESVWLFGVSISTCLLVWSIAVALLATRRDVKEFHRRAGREEIHQVVPATLKEKTTLQPILQDTYFRAGVLGLPFCIIEWSWKDQPVFLLGGVFFAGLLVSALLARWRWNNKRSK